jgi:hypothetical protein
MEGSKIRSIFRNGLGNNNRINPVNVFCGINVMFIHSIESEMITIPARDEKKPARKNDNGGLCGCLNQGDV